MYKKIITAAIAFTLVVSVGAHVASAQTGTTTAERIQALLKQVKELQVKIAALQAEIQTTIALARDLKEGMSSKDVKALQELLAADREVYPEGIVSGYFGPLTAKAVRRFQMKHGIEAVGMVGPKTRAKLNMLAGDTEFTCKAWGHLIAPGYLKKVGNATVDLSKCSKVPPGITKNLGRATTTTTSTDTRAPRIMDLVHLNIASTTAQIKWRTNKSTSAAVWYSIDSDVIDGTDLEIESRSSLMTSHIVELGGLTADTTYHYLAVSADAAGNTATSSIANFTTNAE